MKKTVVWFYLALFMLTITTSYASAYDADKVPHNLMAGLFCKVFILNKSLSGDIKIFVINDAKFSAEMKEYIGKDLGGGLKIVSVEEGADLPAVTPDILYIGSDDKLKTLLEYTKSNKILSITGMPSLIERGVSLGLKLQKGKPRIFLNVGASKAEGVDWKPAILSISKQVII